MQREARGCRGRHGDVEGGTETSRAHGDVERHTEMPSVARRCRASHGDAERRTETPSVARRHREGHGDAERHTETPSDFGQAFAQGQAPRPKGEGLDHERKGWS